MGVTVELRTRRKSRELSNHEMTRTVMDIISSRPTDIFVSWILPGELL